MKIIPVTIKTIKSVNFISSMRTKKISDEKNKFRNVDYVVNSLSIKITKH